MNSWKRLLFCITTGVRAGAGLGPGDGLRPGDVGPKAGHLRTGLLQRIGDIVEKQE